MSPRELQQRASNSWLTAQSTHSCTFLRMWHNWAITTIHYTVIVFSLISCYVFTVGNNSLVPDVAALSLLRNATSSSRTCACDLAQCIIKRFYEWNSPKFIYFTSSIENEQFCKSSRNTKVSIHRSSFHLIMDFVNYSIFKNENGRGSSQSLILDKERGENTYQR